MFLNTGKPDLLRSLHSFFDHHTWKAWQWWLSRYPACGSVGALGGTEQGPVGTKCDFLNIHVRDHDQSLLDIICARFTLPISWNIGPICQHHGQEHDGVGHLDLIGVLIGRVLSRSTRRSQTPSPLLLCSVSCEQTVNSLEILRANMAIENKHRIKLKILYGLNKSSCEMYKLNMAQINHHMVSNVLTSPPSLIVHN